MAENKYSIIRVDDRCPVEVEEDIYLTDRIKMFPCFNDKRLSCKNCRYGDTKRQFVKKVATAILRTLKDGEVLKYEEFGTGFIKQPVSVEYLAESIVEFLGVEE